MAEKFVTPLSDPGRHEAAIIRVKIRWREAEEADKTADVCRWDVAEQLWNLHEREGVTQAELAEALERKQSHISFMIKVWRFYGGDDEGRSFNECYQKSKRQGSPKENPDDNQSEDDLDGGQDESRGESDHYLGNASGLKYLLDAISDGIDPAVMADKVAENDWEFRREEAEDLYAWVCTYADALENRFNSVA
jgi:hypothetical protein